MQIELVNVLIVHVVI